ncbi:MAG TPA: MerR family transcriptional regulator [Lactobacillaceae bacterium]|jgi:DNA-binding transcriptional MerR regulator
MTENAAKFKPVMPLGMSALKKMSIEKLEIRIGELARMVGVSARQLRYWEQQGYLESLNREDEQKTRMYGFGAYITASGIKALMDDGYTLHQAVDYMNDHKAEAKIIHDIMQNAVIGLGEIDGERVLNMGYFDDAHTQYLIARGSADGPRFSVIDVADVEKDVD